MKTQSTLTVSQAKELSLTVTPLWWMGNYKGQECKTSLQKFFDLAKEGKLTHEVKYRGSNPVIGTKEEVGFVYARIDYFYYNGTLLLLKDTDTNFSISMDQKVEVIIN